MPLSSVVGVISLGAVADDQAEDPKLTEVSDKVIVPAVPEATHPALTVGVTDVVVAGAVAIQPSVSSHSTETLCEIVVAGVFAEPVFTLAVAYPATLLPDCALHVTLPEAPAAEVWAV